MYGWWANPKETKRPTYVGKFAYDYVYKLLPEPVVQEIRKNNLIIEKENKNYRRNNILLLI